ncbi:MAG TPA: hypothetical protein VFC19_12420 [Candidatus Limnocylindrales bacterium]|nr:hypothetical protein [Candidatus Limnocylindrales bacterium]
MTPQRLSWIVYPVLQLRTSGFGWAATVPRPAGEAAAAYTALHAAETALADAQTAFVTTVFPRAKQRFPTLARPERNLIIACSRNVRRGLSLTDGAILDDPDWTDAWARSLAERDAAAGRFAAAYDTEYGRSIQQIRRISHDTRVWQAIGQSSPGFADRFYRTGGLLHDDHKPLRGKDRTELATASRFLRRLGTRCETVSFFGPTLYATIEPEAAQAVTATGSGPQPTDVDAAAWLVRELAARSVRSVAPGELPVSRDPLWYLDSGHLVRVPDGKKLAATDLQQQLWSALDGWQTVADLASRCHLTVAQTRQQLAGIKVALRLGFLPPSTTRHGLAWLTGRTPTGPAHRLQDRLSQVATTAWPARAELLADTEAQLRAEGLPTNRNAGGQYADRSFWHEECASALSEHVTFGKPVADGVGAALAAIVPLLYLIAILERADARAAVRQALGGRPVNLAVAASLDVPAATPRADALRAAVANLISSGSQLSRTELDAVCAPFWSTLDECDLTPAPALPGFDLMAAGADIATATWVLGEVHDDSSAIFGGSSSRVHSDPERLYNDFCAELIRVLPTDHLATVVSRRRSMHITPELPGVSIELTGVSAKPSTHIVPIARVRVAADGTGVDIDGKRHYLYPGDLRSPMHRALSLPCLRTFTLPETTHPRVTVDGMVLLRATWTGRLGGDATPGPAHFRAMQTLRLDLGLPRHVFTRHEREPKPVFIDLDDPVAVDDLARFGAGRFTLTECLPGPDQLWWTAAGPAQAAELRLACLIVPDWGRP